jgi:hypothetical protein
LEKAAGDLLNHIGRALEEESVDPEELLKGLLDAVGGAEGGE